MKPFLRVVVAGLVFLLCLALGAVGGCFLGLIGGASTTSTVLLLTLLGAVAGLLVGAFLVSAYLNRISR